MAKYWTDGTSLYHYGIPGQKWGVQNGPPYPLGTKQLSSRERHKRYDKKRSSKLKLTDKERRLARIGFALAVTGLAVYGSYKLNQLNTNIEVNKLLSKPSFMTDVVYNFAKRNNIPIKQELGTLKDDIEACLKGRPLGDSSDCHSLALAICFRRMGLDVYPVFDNPGISILDYDTLFSDFNEAKHDYSEYMPTTGALNNEIDNARISNLIFNDIKEDCQNSDIACGIIAAGHMYDNDKGEDEYKGHISTWFKENDEIRFIDLKAWQYGIRDINLLGDTGIMDFSTGYTVFVTCRIDNLTPTDDIISTDNSATNYLPFITWDKKNDK